MKSSMTQNSHRVIIIMLAKILPILGTGYVAIKNQIINR
jgi:hypothetical protein